MKNTLLTLALAAVSLSATGQGKVTLCNDGNSLYAVCGQVCLLCTNGCEAIPTSGPLPDGVVLTVGLYGGTTSTGMTLQTNVLIDPMGGTGAPSAGSIPFTHVTCSFPGGSLDYFQVFIWDSAYANPQASREAGSYYGANNIFQMIPGTSIASPNVTGGGSSTWAAAGNETPLYVQKSSPIPPPPRPVLQSATLNNGTILLTWSSEPGFIYWVEYKTDLTQPTWSTLFSAEATNYTMSASDSIHNGDPHRFYRILAGGGLPRGGVQPSIGAAIAH
ncbi:exported hypothetical protein [Verrucomicrobia bacterium]|nr:exported hypothetical protein [Verrucomicrobiota bacterium]